MESLAQALHGLRMVAPDPSVLAGGLTKMIAHIRNQYPDPLFKTQMADLVVGRV